MMKQKARRFLGTTSRSGTRLLLFLLLLLPAFATGAWGAEMVTNGAFNGSTGWTFGTATYDSATTRTAGSGSAKAAATRNVTTTGTVTQTVSIPAGSTIDAVALYSRLVTSTEAAGDGISVSLRYVDATTVNVLNTGELTNSSSWTLRSASPALVLTQPVNQIIVTLATRGGSVSGSTSSLWSDELSISYTPSVNNTIAGAMSFFGATDKQISVQVAFSGDDNNDNGCVIAYGTAPGSYPNTAPAPVKGAGLYSSTVSGLTPSTTYYFQATFSDPDGVPSPVTGSFATTAPLSDPLLHNSINLGNKYWSANNGWGVAGSQYGEFTCTTCHNRNSNNIKRVVNSIPATIGTAVLKQVSFNNVTAFGNDAGGHATSKRICEVCHTQTSVHKYNQTTGDLNHKSANLTDCTSCHAHNRSFGASCNSCHGYPPIGANLGANGLAEPATGILASGAGAHALHVNVRGMTCETCHQGYTANPMGNQRIEFGFNVNGGTIPGFKGTFNGGTLALKIPYQPYSGAAKYAGTTVDMTAGNNNTCSNLYCHGGYSGSNGSLTAPSWTSGIAASNCGACHGTTQAAPPTSGNHARHTGTAAGNLGIACSDCHGTLPAGNAHVNGNVVTQLNPASKLRANATYKGFANQSSAALSYGTCAVYCHSTVQDSAASAVATPTVTPTWGDVPIVSCATSACHGNPPANANHTTHVSAGYDCNVCHSAAGKDTAKHADYNIDVAFSGVAGSGTYSQSGSNPPGNGFGTCSATYCHNGAASAPSWNGTALPTDCTGCHGNEVTAATKLSGAHNAHLNNTNQGGVFKCNSCHAPTIANTDNRTISNNALHVNGMVNYSGIYAGRTMTCSTFYCHSNGKGGAPVTAIPAWTSGTTLGCNGCHGTTGNTSGMPSPDAVGVNSHLKHLPTQDTTKCVYCHDTTVNGSNAVVIAGTHLNKARDVRFSKPSSFTNNSGAFNAAARTCSATYCHGSAASDAWGTAGPLTCNKCHDASSALPGAHGIHYNSVAVATGLYGAVPGSSSQSATAYQFACSACHGTTAAAHADMPKTNVSDATIFFSFSSAGRGAAATSAYTRQATGSVDAKSYKWTAGGNGNCSATYCHSNGRGSNGASATVNWGLTARDASCATCHGNATTTIAGSNPATTPGMLSGAHKSHIGNVAGGGSFGCVDCHASTLSSNTAIAANSYAKHVNKFVDYSGAYAGKAKTCSTFTCHSNGKGGVPLVSVTTTATWNSGATLDCSGCHGSTSANLTTGNHAAHLLKGANCTNCHWNTTQGANTIFSGAQHINRSVGVVQGSTFGTTPITVSFTGTTNCSNINCHSMGKFGNPTATWGGSLKCDGCHAVLSTGAHGTHSGLLNLSTGVTFYGYSSNKSAGVEVAGAVKYGFGCANCHPTDEATYHMNGTVEVQLNPATTGASALRKLNLAGAAMNADKSCDLVYCHGDGKNPLVAGATPNGHGPIWTTTFVALGGDRCAKCHGNSPQTGAHDAHQVGLHYNNVFKGTSGKLAAAASGSSSHGVAGQSSTITCNTCHYKTATSSANDQNALCNTCHTKGVNGALVKGNAAISDLSFHVNGKKDIAFPTTPLKVISKAQLRTASFSNYSGIWVRNGGNYKNGQTAFDTAKTALSNTMFNAGNCSNISCHNLRVGQSVNWNDTTISCTSCHSSL